MPLLSDLEHHHLHRYDDDDDQGRGHLDPVLVVGREDKVDNPPFTHNHRMPILAMLMGRGNRYRNSSGTVILKYSR